MNDDPKGFKQLAEKLTCPVCEESLDYLQDVQNPQPLSKGNLIVCGLCGAVLEVGDSALIKAPKETLVALDEKSKALLKMLVTSVLAKSAVERTGIAGGPN